MVYILFVIIALIIFVVAFMQQQKFGSLPKGKILKQIQQSPYFKNGKFENLSYTPALTEGVSYYAVMKEFFFEKNKRAKPSAALPSIKTNLHQLDINKNVLVWFGHSSYFMQIDRRTFLVDPVFSGAASPIKFTTKSFKGADVYSAEDIPPVDYLVITHDHWDHLDYDTIVKLKAKVSTVICGLGVGQHFERWGYDMEKVIERQWNEIIPLEDGFTIHTAPARHFSGRTFKRNTSLWMSYVLQTRSLKIFIGGDSGYDTHFEEIGATHGPFNLAILECGQYDKSWKYIHSMPDEVIKIAKELKAKKVMPVHWGKFQLGNHAWNEPIDILTELAKDQNVSLITPMIGQVVYLEKEDQLFSQWWKDIQ